MLALLEMLMPGASRPAADKAPGTGRHVSLRSRAQGGLWRGWGCSLGGGREEGSRWLVSSGRAGWGSGSGSREEAGTLGDAMTSAWGGCWGLSGAGPFPGELLSRCCPGPRGPVAWRLDT